MKRYTSAGLLAALSVSVGLAQVGTPSTGADGALNVTAPGVSLFDPVALNVDADGDNVFHFTSVNIASGSTLQLVQRRMRRQGPVVFLVQGNVTIGGTLSLQGQHFSGTFGDPGPGGFASGHSRSTSGYGPGAGRVAAGVTPGPGIECAPTHSANVPASANCAARTAYGSPSLQPLIGGSGGIGTGSEGGWGAIRISAGNEISVAGTGSITAGVVIGPNGGAVHLQAPVITLLGGLLAARIRLDRNVQNGGPLSPLADQTLQLNPLTPVPLPANVPELRVTSVNGVPVPDRPLFNAINPDVSTNSTSSVQVVVSGRHIPPGTQVILEARANGSDASLDRPSTTGILTAVPGSTTDTTATITMNFGNAVYYVLARAVW